MKPLNLLAVQQEMKEMLKRFPAYVLIVLAGLWLGVFAAYLTTRPADLTVTPTASATSFTFAVAAPEPTPRPDYPAPTARPPLPASAPWIPLVRFSGVRVDRDSVAQAARAIISLNLSGADYIVLEISSEGGDVTSGRELARVIEMSTAPVHCVVDGDAQSMATYILQSCDARSMTRRSFLMIHEPSIYVESYQRTTDARNQETYLRHFTDAFLHQYHRLKISFAELKRRVGDNRNWYLSADEALAVGAVDSIVDSVEEVRHSYSHARRRTP